MAVHYWSVVYLLLLQSHLSLPVHLNFPIGSPHFSLPFKYHLSIHPSLPFNPITPSHHSVFFSLNLSLSPRSHSSSLLSTLLLSPSSFLSFYWTPVSTFPLSSVSPPSESILRWRDLTDGTRVHNNYLCTMIWPLIYTAPCVMFFMWADTLRGQMGGGWALEIDSFLWLVKWHPLGRGDRADTVVSRCIL